MDYEPVSSEQALIPVPPSKGEQERKQVEQNQAVSRALESLYRYDSEKELLVQVGTREDRNNIRAALKSRVNINKDWLYPGSNTATHDKSRNSIEMMADSVPFLRSLAASPASTDVNARQQPFEQWRQSVRSEALSLLGQFDHEVRYDLAPGEPANEALITKVQRQTEPIQQKGKQYTRELRRSDITANAVSNLVRNLI